MGETLLNNIADRKLLARIAELERQLIASEVRATAIDAVLQGAPHDAKCATRTWRAKRPNACDCWKAQAVAALVTA